MKVAAVFHAYDEEYMGGHNATLNVYIFPDFVTASKVIKSQQFSNTYIIETTVAKLFDDVRKNAIPSNGMYLKRSHKLNVDYAEWNKEADKELEKFYKLTR